MAFTDWYALLGIQPDADAKTVTQAYRKGCFEWHPDRHGDDSGEAHRRFLQLSEAYAVLGDRAARADYDLEWGLRHGRPNKPTRRPFASDSFDRVVRAAEKTSWPSEAARQSSLNQQIRVIVKELAAREGIVISRFTLFMHLFAFVVCVLVGQAIALSLTALGDWSDASLLVMALPLPAASLWFLLRAVGDAWRARTTYRRCQAEAERMVRRQ